MFSAPSLWLVFEEERKTFLCLQDELSFERVSTILADEISLLEEMEELPDVRATLLQIWHLNFELISVSFMRPLRKLMKRPQKFSILAFELELKLLEASLKIAKLQNHKNSHQINNNSVQYDGSHRCFWTFKKPWKNNFSPVTWFRFNHFLAIVCFDSFNALGSQA